MISAAEALPHPMGTFEVSFVISMKTCLLGIIFLDPNVGSSIYKQ